MPAQHDATTTYFDTPGRRPVSLVAETARAVQDEPYIASMLEAIPGPAFLLNPTRQIVLGNRAGWTLAESLGGSDGVTGLRIGEALACLNVPLGPDGCGTGPRCRHCGLGQANLAFGRNPGEYDTEFRLRSLVDGVEVTHTFAAHVSPFQVFDETMRLCSLTDITASKSRETHEHIFFHDVLNTAQAVQAQIFQRFFSTKASSGRGLGTYGVRLLVTRVLGGTVRFASTPEDGTTFFVRLPRDLATPPTT